MASLSGGYVIWTIFNSKFIAIVSGIFWGSVIGNIDRSLVSLREINWVVLFVRFIGSTAISFVVTVPLTVKIFEKPINARISENIARQIERKNHELLKIYSSDDLKIQELEKKYLQARLKKLEEKLEDDSDNFITRIQALDELGSENHLYQWLSVVIILMFICLDMFPILLKISTDERYFYLYHRILKYEDDLQLKLIDMEEERIGIELKITKLANLYIEEINKRISENYQDKLYNELNIDKSKDEAIQATIILDISGSGQEKYEKETKAMALTSKSVDIDPDPDQMIAVLSRLESQPNLIEAVDEASLLYERYIDERKYAEGARVADEIYKMYEKIAESLKHRPESDEYINAIAWSSYWKIRRDVYNSRRGI